MLRRKAWVIAALIMTCLILLPNLRPAGTKAQFGELIAFESPGNTAYYLDAEAGDDEAPGTRPEFAWKTLGRVNATRFAPGDTIYIKAATTYHGQLFPKGSGIPGRPVTIDSFGDGPRPAIHADGQFSAALMLENTNAWHVKNLELTNAADQTQPFRYGLSVLAEDTGNVGDFHLFNLFIHDISGEANPGLGEGAAIIFRNRGTNAPARFDGLLIEKCQVQNASRHGICIDSDHTDRNRWLANLNVVLRENTIKQVVGDGIRLTGCENAIVEYNSVDAAGLTDAEEAGGISLHGCDNALVQFNQVSMTRGLRSAALRCSTNSRDNTFQFNFTRDNQGAMARIVCAVPQANRRGADAGNLNTVVRYNISQNDTTAFELIGAVREASLYNNTVYSGPDRLSTLVRLTQAGPPAADVLIANNAFFTHGCASLDLPPQPEDPESAPPMRFQHNAYFGDCQQPADELKPVTDDPRFIDPGMGQSLGLGLNGYQTQAKSPLRGAGLRLTSHSRFDFWANPIPAGAPVDIGAYQAPSDNPASR